MWNGAQEKSNDENDEKLISNGEETSANSTRKETEEGLSLLENLVHPEEELLDEINDQSRYVYQFNKFLYRLAINSSK